MKRYFAWMLALLVLAGVRADGFAAADGYWTTNEDLYYHIDKTCTGAERMYPISREAAIYFDKLACAKCIEGVWQPYYTGEFGEWPYETDPWASAAGTVQPDEQRWQKRYQENSASPDKLDAAFKKYGMQADYSGRYYSVSGDLVIVLTDPSIERAEQYAQICGGDIWVVEAKYSMETLSEAQEQMNALVAQWNRENEKQVRVMMSSYGNDRNRVEAVLDGRGVVDFMAAVGNSLHPAVQVNYCALDIRADGPVPRAPISRYETDDYVLSLVQDAYLPGAARIGVMLESKDGGLMHYEMGAALYKYAGAEELAQLQADWKGEYNGRESVFRYAEDGFVELASDFASGEWTFDSPGGVWGVANGGLCLEWDMGRWDSLGEGFYRLDTGMGVLEFVVRSDAAPLEMPEDVRSAADFDVPAHEVGYSDAASYISDEDPDRAGQDMILVGDRIYWIHRARHSNVEMGYVKSMILSAPADDPADVCIVYGPVDYFIRDLADNGGIVFIEGDTESVLKRISYNGSQAEELARRSGYVHNLLMCGDLMYYCDDQCIYSYDLKTGTQKRLYETQDSIYSGFQIYEGKLVFSIVNWSDEKKSAIYAIDLETMETRKLASGKHWFYMVKDGRLLTSEYIGSLSVNSFQKLPEGLYACYWDEATGDRRYALLPWTHEGLVDMPEGLVFLGGRYYTCDADGNMALLDARELDWIQ